ncbi:hypothetical protein VUR80DRAFT_2288 [Thermomyces stellatus]
MYRSQKTGPNSTRNGLLCGYNNIRQTHWSHMLGAEVVGLHSCSHFPLPFAVYRVPSRAPYALDRIPDSLTPQKLRPQSVQCSFIGVNIGSRRRHRGRGTFLFPFSSGNDLEDCHHLLGRYCGSHHLRLREAIQRRLVDEGALVCQRF